MVLSIARKLLGHRARKEDEERAKQRAALSLIGPGGQPNLSDIMIALRDVRMHSLTIKANGYAIARQLAAVLPPPTATEPRIVGLGCKASVQVDIESDWLAHWCRVLQAPVVYHRKLWELCYVLQALHEHGCLVPGKRGLGFGCGEEVIPSYLAAQGIDVTITDLPPEDARAAGWAATNQLTVGVEQAFHPHLVDRETYDRLVKLLYVDMNRIPDDLVGHDFCWSVCAIEHLGSIEQGLDFVANSLRTLKPGGISVHTTEFNMVAQGETIDNWPTVLFQRRHVEALADRLRAEGHWVAPLDFTYGTKPMDTFVDVPPWRHDLPDDLNEWLGESYHLKLAVDGFPCTCFGLIVRKAG